MSVTSPELVVRARPHLGTIVRIETYGASQDLVTRAFEEIGRLEKLFNFHDPASVLSQFNNASEAERARIIEATHEFRELLHLSDNVTKLSGGFFNPIRDGRLDLSGIAKGFIVDKAVEWLIAHFAPADRDGTLAPSAIYGSVNAGGDLRFFSSTEPGRAASPKIVILRLGTAERAVGRKLKLSRPCVATSSPFSFNERVFFEKYPRAHAAVVEANCAAVADALTKVALFAPRKRLEMCCQEFSAVARLFDENGELVA